jgi:hypothetical protein
MKIIAKTTRKAVFKNKTIRVISLVLKAASKCASTNDFDRVAILILSPTNRIIGT